MNFEREPLTPILSPLCKGTGGQKAPTGFAYNRLSLPKGEGRVRVLP
jgi:hypothetical protein